MIARLPRSTASAPGRTPGTTQAVTTERMRRQVIKRRAAASLCGRLGHDFEDTGLPPELLALVAERLCRRCGSWIAMMPPRHARSRCVVGPFAPGQPIREPEWLRAPAPYLPYEAGRRLLDRAPIVDLGAAHYHQRLAQLGWSDTSTTEPKDGDTPE